MARKFALRQSCVNVAASTHKNVSSCVNRCHFKTNVFLDSPLWRSSILSRKIPCKLANNCSAANSCLSFVRGISRPAHWIGRLYMSSFWLLRHANYNPRRLASRHTTVIKIKIEPNIYFLLSSKSDPIASNV